MEVTSPPMTTMASGFWISEPGPVANKSGTRPKAAMLAVISTGRSLRIAPSNTALSRLNPLASNSLKWLTITRPFKTAMPSRAIKPTDAGTERYSPEAQRVRIPPTSANGTLARMRADWRIDLSVANSTRNIRPSAIGTTTESLAAARLWFSNSPPQTSR